MGLIRGISLGFREDLDLESLLPPIIETGFDTLFAVLESEADETGIELLNRYVPLLREQGLQTVAYLADGSRGLRCLSREEEISQKVRDVQNLAAAGVSGIIFRGFATSCYYCERCALSLEKGTGLRLPQKVVGNPEEARKWYSPDPMVYGFDNPYDRGNRIEEVLKLVEWMSNGLKVVASRIAAAVAEVDRGCRLGLVGLNPPGLKVLAGFSRHCAPIVVPLPNTFVTADELELYIRKFPFEGLRREWTNLMATSAYYHAPEELKRIILKAGVEGRYGVIIWAAGGVSLSFGRAEDMTQEHWAAVRQAFDVIRDYEEECEGAEYAPALYYTKRYVRGSADTIWKCGTEEGRR